MFGMGEMGGSGIAGGAASGAAMGTMAFPGIGTAIGAGVGAIGGAMGDNEKKKKEEAMRPKNRRMREIQNSLNAYREQQLAGKMTAAQSAFDWANSLRV